MFVWLLEGKVDDPGEAGRQLARWSGEFGDTPGYLGGTGGVTDDRRFLRVVSWWYSPSHRSSLGFAGVQKNAA